MKKKLLTILLSVFMVLAALPISIFADISTVDDVTREASYLPKAERGDVPYKNSNGAEAYWYIAENPGLSFKYEKSSVFLKYDVSVTPSGDNYVCTVDDITYTFYMTDGKLSSIALSGSSVSELNGNYLPPEFIDAVDLSSLKIGEEYANTTPSDVGTVIDAFETDKYEVYSHSFFTKNTSGTYAPMNDSDSFVAGNTYKFFAFLNAKDDYYFKGEWNDIKEMYLYSGTLTPNSNVVDNAVMENVSSTDSAVVGKCLIFSFDFTIAADFANRVIVEDDGHGIVAATVNGVEVKKAEAGTFVTLSATAQDGYLFKQWYDFRDNLSDLDIYDPNPTFEMPDSEVKVKALFKGIAYNYTKKKEYDSLRKAINEAVSGDEIELYAEENSENIVLPAGVTLYTYDGYTGQVTTDVAGKGVCKEFMFGQFTYKFYVADEYEIVYKDQGNKDFSGTHEDGYPTSYVYGSIPEIKSASKDGYTFEGWYIDSECKEPVDLFYFYTNDKTAVLYAKWEAIDYNIIIEDDGHGTAKAQINNVDVTVGNVNDTVKLIANANDGYALKQWQIIRGIDAVANNSFTMPCNEVKLKAIFERVYNINTQDNGHGSLKVQVNGSDVTIAGKDVNVSLIATPDDGYYLDHYEIVSGTLTINDDEFVMPSSNITIKAVFKKKVAKLEAYDGSKVTYYDNLQDALDACDAFETASLLTDLSLTEDVTINELGTFDLNNHSFNTTGNIVNNGVIVIYNKNLDIFDYLFNEVGGCFSNQEELKLPNASSPSKVIPAYTFMTSNYDSEPDCHDIRFVVDEAPLVWNEDIAMGTFMRVSYDLEFSGDIISPNSNDMFETQLDATHLVLTDDITIGSNNEGDGLARLSISSSSLGSEIGSIDAQGHTITLNLNSELITSSNVTIDEDMLVVGYNGMVIVKIYDEENDVYIYSLAKEHHYENEEITITDNYKEDLEFITNAIYEEDSDVTVEIDNIALDSSDYDLAHGSTHVTIHNSVIHKLKAGKHTITIGVKGYETIDQNFYIKSTATPYNPPKTGVDGNNGSLFKLSSLVILSIAIAYIKKKEEE